MIAGVRVEVGREAVVIASDRLLRVCSSAVVAGGLGRARAVINLHVDTGDPCEAPEAVLRAFARRAAVPAPWVGLLTGARTEHAAAGTEAAAGVAAWAVATVGLSNAIGAGRPGVRAWAPGTINLVVVVDADPAPAALVNAVITATEVKALALAEAGIVAADGGLATGTSTDAVVIAATGRGPRARFGGPVAPLGWAVARAVRGALDEGIRGWRDRNG